ncbi:hypothetical protein DFH06DRAFT_1072821 [Mycena polygramma]|nr:hypothetical protein DFH06DRAFT_1072821 [Mycena polygramma]
MDLDVQSIPPKHVEDLWFEDGNIVIQAGNSQYRVFRGILAAHSPVFANLFGLPQPADSELVDGCPFVQLPDPDAEVTPFLKAIFDPEFFMPYPACTNFDAVAGCLRLSHKYGVEYLFRRALVHFSSGYQTTLSQFDDYTFNDNPSQGPSWEYPDEPAFRIRAIELARQVDATWILPRAFYSLSNQFDDLGAAIFHGTVHGGVQVQLSLQDQTSFLNGHAVQCSDTAVNAIRFLSNPLAIEGCLSPSHCYLARLDAIEVSREFILDHPSHFLYVWVPDDWHLLEDICPVCLARLKRTRRQAREAWWNKLPQIYGLPAWPELEQMKTAAIGTS